MMVTTEKVRLRKGFNVVVQEVDTEQGEGSQRRALK